MFITVTNAFSITDKEMGIIINLAGKQRMLTQKMSKHSLLIAEKIEVKKNTEDLKKAAELFDRTLKGLMYGDKGLRLAKTDSKEIFAQLKKVQNLWIDFKKYIDAVLAGDTSKEVLNNIAKKNVPLLKNMHKAVTMFVAKSGKLSKLNIDTANDINVAGRQRMLTQKMSKELLLIDLGINVKNNRKNLKKTIALFDKSLKALLYGDKEMGLKGCKLNHIKKQLLLVEGYWKQIKPTLNETKYSKPKLKAITDALNLTLVEMDKAVKMYEQSVKRQIKIFQISSLVSSYEKILSQNDNLIDQSYLQQARTQKMVKEIILMVMGVDPAVHKKLLKKSAEDFDKILNGFLNGDEKLGIAKISDAKTRAKLQNVKKEWIPFYENIKKLEEGNIDREALIYVLNNNEKLLHKSNALTLNISSSQGANSGVGAYQASKVALIQRERYLLQKMTKERLLIEGNIDVENNLKKISGSLLIFDNILKGNKKFGSLDIQHPKVKKQFMIVKQLWVKMKPKFQKKGKLSDSDLIFLIKNTPVLDENLKKLANLMKKDTSE